MTYIDDKSMPVVFWQRDSNGSWKNYTLPIYVTKDISTLTGLREITIRFKQPPTDFNYYPRQNDILIPAVDTSDSQFKFYGLSWTDSFFKTEHLDNIGIGNAVLFLSEISENEYKFKPITNLDESILFKAGSYNVKYILNWSLRPVWNRLINGHPFLKEFTDSNLPVNSSAYKYKKFDNPTTVKVSDAFEDVVKVTPSDFDMVMKTYPNNNRPFTIEFINRGSSSIFTLSALNEKLTAFKKRTRNTSDGTNVVLGYNQKTGNDYKYAWLNESGRVVIGTTYPQLSSPRFGYTELQDPPTDGELIERATSMLKGSLYQDYDELDFKLDLADRYVVGTGNNPSTPNTAITGTFWLNTTVGVMGLSDKVVYLEVRELDLLNGAVIIGKNNDITLGD